MTQTPRQNVTFPSNGSTAHGYLAAPPAGSGPGVIVIQEWWGLTDDIAELTDRLAAAGFVALAPDLYGGSVAHGGEEAGRLMAEMPVDRATRDLAGAVDYLLAQDTVTSSKVGAVGFCMGGGFVLLLAAQQGDRVAAAVPFYGVSPEPTSYEGLTAAVQGHYAEQDAFHPVEGVRELERQIRAESGSQVEFFYYPAGHAFVNETNKLGTYDAANAELAWGRAVEFLRANVHD